MAAPVLVSPTSLTAWLWIARHKARKAMTRASTPPVLPSRLDSDGTIPHASSESGVRTPSDRL